MRSDAVAPKIALHLGHVQRFLADASGHDRLARWLRRDVRDWHFALVAQGLAPATINGRLDCLAVCTSWVHAPAPRPFPAGDPATGIDGSASWSLTPDWTGRAAQD